MKYTDDLQRGIPALGRTMTPLNGEVIRANTSVTDIRGTNIKEYNISRPIGNNIPIYTCYIYIYIVGQGAYSVVKSATHKTSGRKVAVKVYEKYRLLDPQRKKSVNREIRILHKLTHPHIVKLYDTIDTAKEVNNIYKYI